MSPDLRRVTMMLCLGIICSLSPLVSCAEIKSRKEAVSLGHISSGMANEPAVRTLEPIVTMSENSTTCNPRHVHLSVGRNVDVTRSSMIVSFSFLSECAQQHRRNAVGAIRVGEVGKDLSAFYLGGLDEALSYNSSMTQHQLNHAKNGETRYFSDVYYHIELNDLKPGTRYQYQCLLIRGDHLSGLNLRRGQSSQYDTNYQIVSQGNRSTFLTPPIPGEWYSPPLDRSIKFAVLGDLAVRPHSRETVKNLELSSLNTDEGKDSLELEFHKDHSKGIDCVLLAGDLAYADGDHTVWDDWLDMMSDHSFFRTIPTQVALGNHDLDHHRDDLEIAQSYETRFRMPQIRPPIREIAPNDLFFPGRNEDYLQAKTFVPYQWGNAYYSFTFGPSKHIVLSSYSSFLPGSTQMKWLLSELSSVDRRVTPWLIVMIHCPLYSTFHDHSREIFMTEARVHLEPVFVRHSVNFVISGHLHSYMRTLPTVDSKPDPRGPIHIIQGNGGRQANEPYRNPIEPEEFVEVRDHSMYGYGTLELCNRTHAQWKWVQTGFNAVDEGGLNGRFEPDFGLHDEVWVLNQLFVDYDDQVENRNDEKDG
ncbi:hypothetical protein ACHAXA_011849 [Cyclostephanos tholiformis]|uniref:Purple acid phosphatase n=1 Tax=Cyclostephanos tholiformis TaxID=382380 RepID=A0ABD3RWH7_9STRA